MNAFESQTAHILRACGQLARCLGVDTPVKLLVVDDDPEYLNYLKFLLTQVMGTKYQVDTSATAAQARPLILENRHDLYVIDLRLGSTSGLSLVQDLQQAGHHFPYVILTGASHDDRVAMGQDCMLWMHKQDYTTASNLDRAFRYAIKSWLTRSVLPNLASEIPPIAVPA